MENLLLTPASKWTGVPHQPCIGTYAIEERPQVLIKLHEASRRDVVEHACKLGTPQAGAGRIEVFESINGKQSCTEFPLARATSSPVKQRPFEV